MILAHNPLFLLTFSSISQNLDMSQNIWSDDKTKRDTDSKRSPDKNEDSRMYTGDSIKAILDRFNVLTQDQFHNGYNSTYYRYEELNQHEPEFDDYVDTEMLKPKIGCVFCKQEITLNTGCYIFCYNEYLYDNDIELVACSDSCPVALSTLRTTQCQFCDRRYLPNIFKDSICGCCRSERQ